MMRPGPDNLPAGLESLFYNSGSGRPTRRKAANPRVMRPARARLRRRLTTQSAGLRRDCQAGSPGFTLIEVLTAVMVLSISLLVIMQLFSGGLKSSRISTDYLNGIFHAREKMEELLLTRDWAPGSYSGEFDDGYRWAAAIEEATPDPDFLEDEDAEARGREPDNLPFVTLMIRLEISWDHNGREKRLALATTALADKQALTEPARP